MLKKLNTYFYFFLLILSIFSRNDLQAKEVVNQSKEKKYQLSVCAIFKNEAKFLKEWIEFHRLAGVDHFYLYNNGSNDRYFEVLRPYIKTGVVTLIHWPDRIKDLSEEKAFIRTLGTQIPAYENAVKYTALNETKWLVFLDVDEYLIPVSANKLTDILDKYKAFPAITLSSDFFDASNNYDILPKRNLLIETVELTSPPEVNIQKHIQKIIVKPELCTKFFWPSYRIIFKDNKSPIALGKKEICINHYLNRSIGYLSYGKKKDKLQVDNRLLSEEETIQLLKSGYEIEDQERPVYRFLPEMLKKLGYDNGWNTLR